MKHLFLAVLFLSFGVCICPANERTVCSLDFDPEKTSGEPALKLSPPAVLAGEGQQGGGLVIAPEPCSENSNYAELSPDFTKTLPTQTLTVEFDFRPDAEFFSPDRRIAYLVDQMYTDPAGIQIYCNQSKKALVASIGNGSDILTVEAKGIVWTEGEWHHIRASYNASQGTLRLEARGEEIGSASKDAFGAFDPGRRALRIGNRLGSLFHAASGTFDNFKISGASD